MIPGAMLIEWRHDHPWPDMAQVEQDSRPVSLSPFHDRLLLTY
jgi:hypothetical protein